MGQSKSEKKGGEGKLSRQTGGRQRNNMVLILTEGRKTEVQYFKDLKSSQRLGSVHIDVESAEDKTCPKQVVQRAYERGMDRYDQIYAVIDRDTHHHLEEACRIAIKHHNKLRGKGKEFFLIISDPSFEIWLLVHYERVCSRLTSKEACQRLAKYLPGYSKNMKGIYSKVREKESVALQNETYLPFLDNEALGVDVPALGSFVHEKKGIIERISFLVNRLRALATAPSA